jgi:hypothetical protein
MSRHTAALGFGLVVTSLFIAAVGVVDSNSGGRVSSDEAFGYGAAVLAFATAGAWLLLQFWQRRDGPR